MICQPNIVVHVTDSFADYMNHSNGPSHHPSVTHSIGPLQYPLTTSQRSTVIMAHYLESEKPFTGPVKNLTVGHIGSPSVPNLFQYARTCKAVEFTGHISSTNAAFEIVSQLPRLKHVSFFLGHTQRQYFSEIYVGFPVCPEVKKLQIIMNLEFFYSFQHDDCTMNNAVECHTGVCLSHFQYSLVHLVENILSHAKESFPNLKALIVELPDNPRLCGAVKSVIQACNGLKYRTQAEVQPALQEEFNNIDEQQYLIPVGYGNEAQDPWFEGYYPVMQPQYDFYPNQPTFYPQPPSFEHLPSSEINYCHYQYQQSYDSTGSDQEQHQQQCISSNNAREFTSLPFTFRPSADISENRNLSVVSRIKDICNSVSVKAAAPAKATDNPINIEVEEQQENLYEKVTRWLGNSSSDNS